MNTAIPSSAARPEFVIPSLNGLRAVSMAIVFLSHVGLGGMIPGPFGVTVFFFLSGYLITTLLRREFDRTGGINLGQFYFRRGLRIFPPLYLTLGLTFLATSLGFLSGPLHAPSIAAQIFYLANYFEIFRGSGTFMPGTSVLWSLAVEEHFYLIFPVFYLILRRRVPERIQLGVLFALCGAVLAWRMVLVYGLGAVPAHGGTAQDLSGFFPRLLHATDTRIDSILFGCILAQYGNPVLDGTRYSRNWWVGVWLPIGLGLCLVTFLYRDLRFRETLRYTVQGIGLFPVFIAAIRYPGWGVFKLLNIGWVRGLGIISYTLYLCHATIIEAVSQKLPSLKPSLQGWVALLLSIGFSTMVYFAIEKPLARIRKRHSTEKADPALPSRGVPPAG
jgi:peptidoglycan/LPS O-acetylase OafA/YrhL